MVKSTVQIKVSCHSCRKQKLAGLVGFECKHRKGVWEDDKPCGQWRPVARLIEAAIKELRKK